MTRLQQLLLLRAPVEALASWRELHNALHDATRYQQEQHRNVVFVLSLYADALIVRGDSSTRERRWHRFINALNALRVDAPLVRTLLYENADLIDARTAVAA